MPNKDNTRYTDEELEEFRQLINKKIAESQKDLDDLLNSLKNTSGNGDDDTAPTFKVLEEGAQTSAREENARQAQRLSEYVKKLRAALVRIDHKTYGISRVTGKLIPKGRLLAMPHATTNVEGKMQK